MHSKKIYIIEKILMVSLQLFESFLIFCAATRLGPCNCLKSRIKCLFIKIHVFIQDQQQKHQNCLKAFWEKVTFFTSEFFYIFIYLFILFVRFWFQMIHPNFMLEIQYFSLATESLFTLTLVKKIHTRSTFHNGVIAFFLDREKVSLIYFVLK